MKKSDTFLIRCELRAQCVLRPRFTQLFFSNWCGGPRAFCYDADVDLLHSSEASCK